MEECTNAGDHEYGGPAEHLTGGSFGTGMPEEIVKAVELPQKHMRGGKTRTIWSVDWWTGGAERNCNKDWWLNIYITGGGMRSGTIIFNGSSPSPSSTTAM